MRKYRGRRIVVTLAGVDDGTVVVGVLTGVDRRYITLESSSVRGVAADGLLVIPLERVVVCQVVPG